jgi:hypothetical protein
MAVDNMDDIRKILLNSKDDQKIAQSEALEIFKLYHESIEKTADKRQSANSFFLTLNTGILAAVGFLFQKDCASEIKPLYFLLPVAGIICGVFWYKLVHSYRQLNCGKFTVLNMIEETLPLAPFKAEWVVLGSGKDNKKYHQITTIEKWIPSLFIALHSLLLFYFMYLLFWGHAFTQKCFNQ